MMGGEVATAPRNPSERRDEGRQRRRIWRPPDTCIAITGHYIAYTQTVNMKAVMLELKPAIASLAGCCTSIVDEMLTTATETLARLTDSKHMPAHCKSYRVLYSQFRGIANTSNMPHAAYDT
jgi:hypothetical protein